MRSRRQRSAERRRGAGAALTRGATQRRQAKVPVTPHKADARAELRWAGGLTFLAWLHRLAFLFSNEDRGWGFSIFYEGDAERFHEYARALLAGTAYDGGIPFHPPAFPAFLAGVYALLGVDATGAVPHLSVKILCTLIASLPVGLVYLLVRPYLGRPAAVLTAALCLYSFGLYILAVTPVSEGLYLLLLLLCLLLWSRGLSHPLAAPRSPEPAGGQPAGAAQPPEGTRRPPPLERGPRRAPLTGLVLGLLLGVLALTRAEGVLIGILLAATGFWGLAAHRFRPMPSARESRWRRQLLPWILVLAGWVLVVGPWTLRNHLRLVAFNRQAAGRLAEPLPTFVPITAYGPLNLALANNPAAEGGFSRQTLPVGKEAGALSLFDPEHLHLFLHGDQVAWDFVRAEPGAFLRLVLRKWAITCGALRLGWTQWDLPGGLRGLRRPVDLFVPYSSVGIWVTAPSILLGLILCLRRRGAPRRWAGITLLLTGHTLLVAGVFFGYARLGVLMLPCWFALVAVGWVQLFLWVVRGRGKTHHRSGWGVLFAGALLLLLAAIWGATGTRRYEAAGTMLPGAGYLNPDATMQLTVVRERSGPKSGR